MTTPEVPGQAWQIELCHRLRIAREKAGLSQAELADSIEISRRSVTAYESGDAKPRRHVLVAWALRTGTSSEWLVSGDTSRGLAPEVTVTYAPKGAAACGNARRVA